MELSRGASEYIGKLESEILKDQAVADTSGGSGDVGRGRS